MKIQTPFKLLLKYFNDFHKYSKKSNVKLVSYFYIPEYLRNKTEKLQKLYSKIIGISNV